MLLNLFGLGPSKRKLKKILNKMYQKAVSRALMGYHCSLTDRTNVFNALVSTNKLLKHNKALIKEYGLSAQEFIITVDESFYHEGSKYMNDFEKLVDKGALRRYNNSLLSSYYDFEI